MPRYGTKLNCPLADRVIKEDTVYIQWNNTLCQEKNEIFPFFSNMDALGCYETSKTKKTNTT